MTRRILAVGAPLAAGLVVVGFTVAHVHDAPLLISAAALAPVAIALVLARALRLPALVALDLVLGVYAVLYAWGTFSYDVEEVGALAVLLPPLFASFAVVAVAVVAWLVAAFAAESPPPPS